MVKTLSKQAGIFFQDMGNGHFEGHISRAHYCPPHISKWHYEGYMEDFDISPVSDLVLQKEAYEMDFERLKERLKQPDDPDFDAYMKNSNSVFFSALSQVRRADFTMRKVT